MGKLRAARERLISAETRLAHPEKPTHLSPAALERERLYLGDKWRSVRRAVLSQLGSTPQDRLCNICGVKGANQLDHLYGHDDAIADELEFCLGLGAAPHWRDRFYTGPFILLCHPCHSRKTMHEKQGRLADWVQANWEVLKALKPTA